MASPLDHLSEVRTLAHKIWGQCRDSSGPYKLLSDSVRNLRNVAEDVEGLLEKERAPGPDDERLLDQVRQVGDVLTSLEVVLVHWRCSTIQDVDQSSVSNFKTSLDVVVRQMRETFTSITTAGDSSLTSEGQEEGDVGVSPSSSPASDLAQSESSVGNVVNQSANSSVTQLDAHSETNGSMVASVDFSAKEHLVPSMEKETVDFNSQVELQRCHTTSGRLDPAICPSWRQPFATPDIMSLDPTEASHRILNESSDDEETLRERQNRLTARSSDNETVLPDHAHEVDGSGIDASTHSRRVQRHVPLRDQDTASNSSASAELSTSNPNADVPTTKLTTVSEDASQQEDHTTQSVVPKADHLSPESASTSDVRCQSHSAGALLPDAGHLTTHEADNNDSARRASMSADIPSVKITDPQSASAAFLIELKDFMKNGFISSTLDETGVPLEGNITPSILNSRSMPNVSDSPASIVHPTNSETGRPCSGSSRYRVVNTSPDDDLYNATPPSSPSAPKISSSHLDEPSTTSKNVAMIPKAAMDSNLDHVQDKNCLQPVQNPSSVKPNQHGRSASWSSGDAVPTEPPAHSQANDMGDHGRSPETSAFPAPPSRPPPPTPSEKPPAAPSGNPPPPPFQKRPRPSVPPKPKELCMSVRANDSTTLNASSSLSSGERPKSLPPPENHNPLTSNARAPSTLGEPLALCLFRKSADEAFNLISKNTSFRSQAPKPKIYRGQIAQIDALLRPRTRYDPSAARPSVNGGFGSGEVSLERERQKACTDSFNRSQWKDAEKYLDEYHTQLIYQLDLQLARRVRHLLGVCASFRGDYKTAIYHFLSVLQTPIKSLSALDAGDCAAAYWLGDAYAMLNRRTEAVLAYCIAERSLMFQESEEPKMIECITAEQEAVILGMSKEELRADWLAQAADRTSNTEPSIIDPKMVEPRVVDELFEFDVQQFNRSARPSEFTLRQDKSRADFFDVLHIYPLGRFYRSIQISNSSFDPGASWPLPCDPCFSMANVQRGLLLDNESGNLAQVLSHVSQRKLASRLSRGVCCSSNDLNWLIEKIRQCLRTYEMDWSEVTTKEGTGFVIRYQFGSDNCDAKPNARDDRLVKGCKIITTHYYSISLFRQYLPSGYGAEICPEGIGSARILNSKDALHWKGVPVTQTMHIKALLRDFLNDACRKRSKQANRRSWARKRISVKFSRKSRTSSLVPVKSAPEEV